MVNLSLFFHIQHSHQLHVLIILYFYQINFLSKLDSSLKQYIMTTITLSSIPPSPSYISSLSLKYTSYVSLKQSRFQKMIKYYKTRMGRVNQQEEERQGQANKSKTHNLSQLGVPQNTKLVFIT